MQSQLSEMSTCRQNFRTVNLVVVAHGNIQTVNHLLANIRQQFAHHLTTLPITYYSDRTLALAEGQPYLLQSKKNPALRISRNNFSREYIGFANYGDYNQLYKYLYSSCECPANGCNYSYYTPHGLSQIIHKHFNSTEDNVSETFGDLVVNLTHTILDQINSYAYITFQINENLAKDNINGHLNWFRSVIASLDSSFSDVVQSAYITLKHSHMPITHTRVYSEYDFKLCNRYLLGAEWYIYLGKHISHRLNTDICTQLEGLAVLEALENGMTCTANGSIFSFDSSLRAQISHIFKDLLIPAFGMYNWCDLHNQEWTVNYLPQTINVYHDPCSKHNPTIVFSYRCDADEITTLKGINPSNLLNSFVLKK